MLSFTENQQCRNKTMPTVVMYNVVAKSMIKMPAIDD